MQKAKRLDSGKKLSDVDTRVFLNTGFLPAEFDGVAPHDLIETWDFSQEAPAVPVYAEMPESLRRLQELESRRSTSHDGWSPEARDRYFASFPNARAVTQGEPEVVAVTGEEMAARRGEAAVDRPAVESPDTPQPPAGSLPDKIDWRNYDFHDLLSKSYDFFATGAPIDQSLRMALSKLRGKRKDWDVMLASKLDLHPYEKQSCSDGEFAIALYFRRVPELYVALMTQDNLLYRFFFIRAISTTTE
jgi:hypothetical protein